MTTSTSIVSFHGASRVVWRVLLIAWAGFWAWFVLAVSLGEPGPPPLWIPVAWLSGLATLVVLGWRRPTLGGIALVATGIWSAIYFDHAGARALLAAPAIGLGLGALALRWSASGAASASLVVLGLMFSSCIAPQDPVDLPFRTSSILRHETGWMKRAFVMEQTEIEGLPCRRWVWWYEDGALDNIELACDLTLQGHDFPARTRLFFDREGRLSHAWLSKNAVIDGRLCRGRWKIDTAFHSNGRLRAFFPPRDLEIDGVLCTASVFHPVYLQADGRLQQCQLARDVKLHGRIFETGAVLQFDGS